MASIQLDNVTIDFPILGFRNLRQQLFSPKSYSRHTNIVNTDSGTTFVRAISDLSLSVSDGMRIGLIGHNGSGKTTLLKVFAGILPPSNGFVRTNGKVVPLFSTNIGTDNDETGYANIQLIAMFLGIDRDELENLMPEIESFSGLGHYLNLPVRTYSAGMALRLTFAVATCVQPEILILDEGLGAGDARFTTKVQQRIDDMIKGASIVAIASHSNEMVKAMTTHTLLMDHGKSIAFGPTEEIISLYEQMNLNYAQQTLQALSKPMNGQPENESIGNKNTQIRKPIKTKTPPESWDEKAYKKMNEDVFIGDKNSKYKSGWQHFCDRGFVEKRLPCFTLPSDAPKHWMESLYLFRNEEIMFQVLQGQWKSGWRQFLKGTADNAVISFDRPDDAPLIWDESSYLMKNPDVLTAVCRFEIKSGWTHFNVLDVDHIRQGSFNFPEDAPLNWAEHKYFNDYREALNSTIDGQFSSGWQHYRDVGSHQGLKGGFEKPLGSPARWSEDLYYKHNLDISSSLGTQEFKSCWDHYAKIGHLESRRVFFDKHPDVSEDFDENEYLYENPGVLTAVINNLVESGWHYLQKNK